MDVSETIVVYIKVCRCSQPHEYMKLSEYQRSRSSIDFCPRSLRFNIFKLFLETARPIEAKFYVAIPLHGEMKVSINGSCHMTKVAAMSLYGKNL